LQNSDVCLAALHAGVISNNGGYFLIQYEEMLPDPTSERDERKSQTDMWTFGSIRNGVRTFGVRKQSQVDR
jgi:hypothetical protein